MHGFRAWAGKRSKRSALLALMVMSIAACGGGESDTSGGPAASGSSPPPPPPAANDPPPAASARAATLEWEAPSTSTDGSTLTDLAGYKIYYGTDVAKMTQTIHIDNPSVSSYVVENLAPATYYFAVSALNSRGHESERSNAGRKEIS